LNSPNKPLDWKAILATLARVACGAVFIYASYDKMSDPEKFGKLVAEYHVLPAVLVPLAAVVIPWLEFLTGICLAVGFRWREAALVFSALMGIYILSLGWNLIKGVEMNCGCFSLDSTEKITWLTVGRDVLFLAMGLLTLTASKTYVDIERFFGSKFKKG